MSIKEKTVKNLEQKIKSVEQLIAKKGVGSEYLSKAEQIQRNVNLALVIGTAGLILGLTALTVIKYRE